MGSSMYEEHMVPDCLAIVVGAVGVAVAVAPVAEVVDAEWEIANNAK